jgi:hypothetical protein
MIQSGLFPSFNHAQKAKHPAISPIAARAYQKKDLIEQ